MPGDSPASVGLGLTVAASDSDSANKGRGRTRYCKKCKFSCTDAREFTAHQNSHTETGDSKRDSVCDLSPPIGTAHTNNVPAKRVLRPKRNSKVSVSESPVTSLAMEPRDISGVASSSAEETESANVAADKPDLSINTTDSEATDPQSTTANLESKPNKGYTEEPMEDEEGGDEPDAMTIKSQSDLSHPGSPDHEVKKLSNGIMDSADEDMDEEDRLVIDDGSHVSKTGKAKNRCYRCHQCDMTTGSAKAYFHHLRDDHKMDSDIYECNLCDYATVYKQKLPKHRRLHFLTADKEDEASDDEKDNGYHNNIDKRDNFLNVSFTDTKLHIEDADDLDEDMDAAESPTLDSMHSSVPLTITADNIDQVLDEDKKKKKKTRQEVDPGKYFEAVDSSGTKYACSQCGNIYKWRKSLNKHWKEKHSMDPLVEVASPPGMLELLKSGKYTQLGARRIYDNTFLSTIKTNKGEETPRTSTSPRDISQSPSPPNFLSTSQNITTSASRIASRMATMMPKMIGPFVASTTQPVFPGMPLTVHRLSSHNGYDSLEESALDLTRDSKPDSRASPFSVASGQEFNTSFDQDQPLDFSRKKEDKLLMQVKTEKWEDSLTLKQAHSINQLISKVHRCSKCDYTSASEVDFANHMSSHLGKRLVKCNECKLQISSMDELNTHFIKQHGKKLTEYKEAIKKIPHGLQQTYHLLKMDLNDISELGNQDLGAAEGKSLKCKKCEFEAKWPAELQKHAVSHSEERPYICMVCGSTYKWKWDLVKHFQKSHPNLPNPYRRNDKRDTPDGSSEEDPEDEPEIKRSRMAMNDLMKGANLYSRDDNISVEGIMAAAQACQRLVSSQPNILDDDPNLERNLALLHTLPFTVNGEASQTQKAQAAQELLDRRNKVQGALQDNVKSRQNGVETNIRKSGNRDSSSPTPGGSKEVLPYKCPMCNYHARWPSEVTQHMKNHSDCKPYLCPRCDYRSKWKWDVVKHLKRCGGGGINDVIDTTKIKKKAMPVSNGPPNAVVSQHGKVQKMTPQPSLSYIASSSSSSVDVDENGQQTAALMLRPEINHISASSSGDDMSRTDSGSPFDLSNGSNNNNNDANLSDNNTNNNYRAYSDGLTTCSNLTQSAHVNSMDDSGPSNNATRSPAPQISTFRHSSSGEIWKCPHCPFKTQSQAELKRHSGLHSDDKPFKCDVCQYSTRWACDLKKHRKSYNHYPVQEVTIVKKEIEEIPSRGRFKCNHCTIYFNTLHGLLGHRVAEHIGRESSHGSPAPQSEQNEIDVARIKHPRKPIKQIQCSKCTFVCKSRQTMDRHMEEHEQMELSGMHCFYCSLLFKDKESLLDHITTHSAFNPKEWETFFMITEEEEQQQQQQLTKYDAKTAVGKEGVTKEERENETFWDSAQVQRKQADHVKKANDYTEARIQQILSGVPKQLPTCQQSLLYNKYKCEWCPAEFANLTGVYKHARQAHPVQLKEQDVGMAAQPGSPVSPSGQQAPTKKHYTGDPIDILRQQIAEKRNHQAERISDLLTNSIKIQTSGSKTSIDSKGNKQYTCDKCSFSSAVLATFQRHYELHGSKQTTQCWFCDYSVDRMDLLYQHMKISHTRKWKVFSQDPKYAKQIQDMSLAFSNAVVYGNNNDSPPEHVPDAMDLSSKPKQSEVIHDIMYITKQQYTWSGIPVNVIPVGSALNFVCPNCSFNDASIAKTCAHVMQSHRAMSKFTCQKCQFYDDNIHVMSDHCKTSHPAHERVVEVLDFKQLNFSELQMVQLSALRGRFPQDVSKNSKEKADKALTTKAMSCPFCPFKSLITEHMKVHVSDHSRQARYRCQMCDFSSDSKIVITDHVKVHEAGYTLDSRSITESSAVAKVKKEPSSKMTSDSDCKSAGKISITTDPSQNSHMNREGSPRSRLSKRIRYRCSACHFQNLCRTNIMKHRKQHNNDKKYQCHKCTYGAARAVLLKKHLECHDVPVEDDGQYHDIFVDPNSSDDFFKNEETDEQDSEVAELDVDEFDEDEANSELDEMDTKAIADLEARDILEAETAHKTTILHDDDVNGDAMDKQFRKQKCPHCPFSSNSGYEFRKHLNFHGTQERYKCDRCSYSLDRLNLLSQHRKLHADEPGFNPNPPASDLLNTSFILQQNHSEEMEFEDGAENSTDEVKSDAIAMQFSCPSCPYKSTKRKSFDIHCNSHGLRKRFICDFCDWSADRTGLLYQHRKVHESEPDFVAMPEEKVFLNHEFDEGASGEFEAKFIEIRSSEKEVKDSETEMSASPPFKLTVAKKSYPCTLCPFKTNSKSSFTYHKNMHNSGAEFACPECSYSATNAGILKQHLHLHSSPEMQSPVLSLKKSPSYMQQISEESDLLTESDLPSSEKNVSQQASSQNEGLISSEFKCQRCPFTAPTQVTLAEHTKGHNSQENLLCPYCDFSAVSKQIMFPHIQLHFPGTKLDTGALERILEENTKSKSESSQNAPNDGPENIVSPKPEKIQLPEKETIKTKRVYVCQYCEREFEAKDLMIQHEKQHLVGSHS